MAEDTKRVLLEMPESLYTAIDDVRGLVPRNAWIRDVLERAVDRRREVRAADAFAEEGRRLASQREDLIAAGVDPSELAVPLAPTRPHSHIHVPEPKPSKAPPPVKGGRKGCAHENTARKFGVTICTDCGARL